MKIAFSLLAFLLFYSLNPVASGQLETVATFDGSTPPGNIAISPEGRIFLSLHGFFGEPAHHVVELLKDGSTKPYPTSAWSAEAEGDGPGLTNVLGVRVDRKGILWMLDGQSEGRSGRLIGWDTRKETLHQIIYLAAPVTTPDSFLNDIAVDRTNEAIYIADSAGALIVVDLQTGRARRVLHGSQFTTPEDLDMVIDNRVIHLGGAPARIGTNPITMDGTETWLYFGAMSSTNLYRVTTADLRNADLPAGELAPRVERYGTKPISDGSTVDEGGNVYITSVTENAIGVTKPDGTYEILYQDPSLSWPDGFATGSDGWVYATVNELHRSPVLAGGEHLAKGVFKVVRFKPLAPVVQGR